jgi:mono/diheme cytochrome c family protein
MKSAHTVTISAILLGAVSACSFRELKQAVPPMAIAKPGAIDFRLVSVAVFQPQCVDCHGAKGGVSVETYAEVLRNLQAIKGVVENRQMPPRSPLSQDAQNLVLQWIADGAPEVVDAAPEPRPPSPPKPPEQPPAPGNPDPVLTLDFETVSRVVLRPSCTSCHGTKGGVNLQTYADAVSDLQLLKDVVESGDMPPRSRPKLTDLQKKTLLDWIALGAPERSSAVTPVPPSPQPPLPPPSPPVVLQPTYQSLERLIFRPRCVGCHSAGSRAEWLKLDSWDAIVNGSSDDDEYDDDDHEQERGLRRSRLIDLERPERSKIVRVVTDDNEDEKMPPPSSNKRPLDAAELRALVDWIAQGAKNN